MDDSRYEALRVVYSRLAMEAVGLRNEINRLVEENNQLRFKVAIEERSKLHEALSESVV